MFRFWVNRFNLGNDAIDIAEGFTVNFTRCELSLDKDLDIMRFITVLFSYTDKCQRQNQDNFLFWSNIEPDTRLNQRMKQNAF